MTWKHGKFVSKDFIFYENQFPFDTSYGSFTPDIFPSVSSISIRPLPSDEDDFDDVVIEDDMLSSGLVASESPSTLVSTASPLELTTHVAYPSHDVSTSTVNNNSTSNEDTSLQSTTALASNDLGRRMRQRKPPVKLANYV